MIDLDAGLPTVLVPGMLCDADLWAGCDIPSSVTVPITEPEIGRMAAQVLAAVDGSFILVGLSLGAIVGFEVLRRAPQRVLAFCAMSTNAGAPTAAQHAAWRGLRADTEAGDFDGSVRRILPTMFAAPEPPPEHARRFLAMAHRVGPEVFLAQLAAQATRIDSQPGLREVTCPVLAVCGDRDALCPIGFHRTVADAVPFGRLKVLRGAGHLLPIERPGEIGALLRAWPRELSHA